MSKVNQHLPCFQFVLFFLVLFSTVSCSVNPQGSGNKVRDTHAFRSKVVRLTPISTSIYGCPRLAIGNERFKKEIEEMLNIKFNRERMGRPKKEKCL